MGRFFTPSRFHKFLLAAFGAVSLAFVFSFTVDLWIQRKLPFIESAISEAIRRPVEIRRAGYTLYHGFILDDFTVKEIKTVPVPFTIKRVRAIPSFSLFPEPTVRIRRLIFVEPRLGVDGNPGELLRAGSLVRALPAHRTKIGSVVLEARLSAFLIERGSVAVFAEGRGGRLRQEFERIDFFAGSGWMKKNSMRLRGRVAGKPEAHFRIESDIIREGKGTLDSNVRIELNEFMTSYLAPYVKSGFSMPDKNLSASIRFKVRDGHRIESSGQFDLTSIGLDDRLLQYLTRRSPKVRYFVSGDWKDGNAEFSKIHLKTRNARMAGSGRLNLALGEEEFRFSLESGEIPLVRYRNLFKPWKLENGTAQMSLQVSGTPKSFDPALSITVKNASVLDVSRGALVSKADGHLLVTPRGIHLDEMWIFVNDVPFSVAGHLRPWSDRRSFSLNVSAFPGQIPSLKPKNPFNGSFSVKAIEKKGLWSGHARGVLEDYSDSRISENVLSVAFKDLSTTARHAKWLMVQGLAARSVDFRLLRNADRWRFDILRAAFEGGRIRATARIDSKDKQWKFRADVAGADFERFALHFWETSPADGRLALRAHAGGGLNKENYLKLRFRLGPGKVSPTPELSFWAAQTGIAALRSIEFHSFGGEISFRPGIWKLNSFRMQSDSAELGADLQIREKRVNGKLSVRFPSRSIDPKSDLAWLMDFANQTEWVDFDFHVAGALSSPRIEWLAGEFKKKIESRLSPWMRSELARRIEQRFVV